ncbi:hypothetical protein [Euryhalocaulis caribicus]|uniref:hypothetical protein n=1 Tax=Euryhalocaulis caribicus TaxID=1161401 RepID=UPI0003AAE11E|nr:hypothetical protein [Euryhalocaulis caribicus]
MSLNLKPSDRAAVAGVIDPDAYTAGDNSTDWISAADFHNFLAMVLVGDIASSGTVDAKIEEATDGSGSGAQDLDGKAITQLTQAGSDSNKQALINLRPEDLSEGFTHFRLTITGATAAADHGGVVLGFDPLYGKASDADLASVDQIV